MFLNFITHTVKNIQKKLIYKQLQYVLNKEANLGIKKNIMKITKGERKSGRRRVQRKNSRGNKNG